ncbi:MAG: hypothetical protein B7Z68_10035 [Acidobacteria bacterium 21-70-11]|nr:MAG: hypothetical protein B7Z68_10035 [Acidobacteria bacterium 21-70-11]HQT94768.1 DUF1684 domain-containing protein [Thermoanaerobaculaceae bacterium]
MRSATAHPRAPVLLGGGIACFLVVLGGCHAPLPTPELRYRQEREQAVKAALPAAAVAEFKGLRFYPFSPAYRFQAMIEPVVPPEPLTIAASNGEQRPAHRVGRVRLRFPNGEAVLSIYQLDDMRASYPDHLFLPFRDAGAGKQTYGAGRYLDLERLPGGVVSLDFNRAYNPDCAYGITGRCPITPPENTVKFAIEAGEMMPPGHH